MPSGGHGRIGRVRQDIATRKYHGAKVRARHQRPVSAGLLEGCAPPPGLSRRERAFWLYYAKPLAAERRLTLKMRDTLAKYCTALAVVAELRRELDSRARGVDRPATRKELRQWVLACRLYENDLLLNPASAVRAPAVDLVLPTAARAADPFAVFDDEDAPVN